MHIRTTHIRCILVTEEKAVYICTVIPSVGSSSSNDHDASMHLW